MQAWQRRFLSQHQLKRDYLSVATKLARCVLAKIDTSPRFPIIGINGPQGSGKSTLADYLCQFLENERMMSVGVVSIDDYYLSKSQRFILSETEHPLFNTRGVPGTHEVSRGIQDFTAFKQGKAIALPRFDKSIDDRIEDLPFKTFDVLIFEGWCVGIKPETQSRLAENTNAFETTFDADGTFRRCINHHLSCEYQEWFQFIDYLLFLKIESFDSILEWRLQQETQLFDIKGKGMSAQQISQFIQFFERLTRWGQYSLEDNADLQVNVDKQHKMTLACKAYRDRQ
ncbi:kinase [Pseudoalteromonas xiamenensis]|uniref:Kinase n=1 Tax=Pseudoalteromonas xiamenensis TaxID=882626 RepID=A0A975DKL6_9GAMM|nr:kinase [Pseudoalteromonas xiamenensis]QTH72081.1 kinase [Pseudoalteromonas xiamenensis]